MFDSSFLVAVLQRIYFLIVNKSEKMQILLFITIRNVLYGIKCVYENVSKLFNFFVV